MELIFDPKSSIIVITPTLVGINGRKKKIDMALDAGATYTMIPLDIAEVLGYALELSKERIELIIASGVEKSPLITLNSLSILQKNAKDVKTIVHDLPSKSYIDGLLGLSFFKKL